MLETIFPLYHLWQANDSTTYVAEIQDKITGLVAFGASPITSDLMDALPRLSIIATMDTGVDHIDLEAVRARSLSGIHVLGLGIELPEPPAMKSKSAPKLACIT